jgi:hypothetical protein
MCKFIRRWGQRLAALGCAALGCAALGCAALGCAALGCAALGCAALGCAAPLPPPANAGAWPVPVSLIKNIFWSRQRGPPHPLSLALRATMRNIPPLAGASGYDAQRPDQGRVKVSPAAPFSLSASPRAAATPFLDEKRRKSKLHRHLGHDSLINNPPLPDSPPYPSEQMGWPCPSRRCLPPT